MVERIMVDIETFGTSNNAVIRSIGAVWFNENNLIPLFEFGVNVESCLWAGLKIDEETVEFWRKQPKEKQDDLRSLVPVDLKEVLIRFNEVVSEHSGFDKETTEIWSHGSVFDIVILTSAYKAVEVDPWWKYKNIRDTRTLFSLVNFEYKAKGGHNALIDAESQAEAVITCLGQLRKEEYK